MNTHLPLTCVANITFHPMASFDSKQFSTFLKKLQGILPDSVRRYIQSATQLWDYRDIFQLLGQTETVPGESGRRATKIKWLRKLYNMSDGGKFYEKRKC